VRRYTLNQAAQALEINPKTLDRWLERAHIAPVADELDRRRRLLTSSQVEALAAQFGKPFRPGGPVPQMPSFEMNPVITTAPDGGDLKDLHQAHVQLRQMVSAEASRREGAMAEFERHLNTRLEPMERAIEILARAMARRAGVSPDGPLGDVLQRLESSSRPPQV
jgi:hypothetical protein